jgi:hypothetical protein
MWALEKIGPRLHLGGHMTGRCFTYHNFSWGKHLRVATSARHRCYAAPEGRTVMVYQRGEEVFLFNM